MRRGQVAQSSRPSTCCPCHFVGALTLLRLLLGALPYYSAPPESSDISSSRLYMQMRNFHQPYSVFALSLLATNSRAGHSDNQGAPLERMMFNAAFLELVAAMTRAK